VREREIDFSVPVFTFPYVLSEAQETSRPLPLLAPLFTYLHHAHTPDLAQPPPRFTSPAFEFSSTVGLAPFSTHSFPRYCASVVVLSGPGLCTSPGVVTLLVSGCRSLSLFCSSAWPGSDGLFFRDPCFPTAVRGVIWPKTSLFQ